MPYLIGCSKSTTFPKKFRAGVPTFAVWSTEHESTILSYNHRLFLTSKNTRCMYRNSNPTCFDSIENWYVPVFYNTKHEYEIISICRSFFFWNTMLSFFDNSRFLEILFERMTKTK